MNCGASVDGFGARGNQRFENAPPGTVPERPSGLDLRGRLAKDRGTCNGSGSMPELTQRELQPELLDGLPHDHPDAQHSRRDLRITNAIMRNHAWMLRALPQLVRAGERILEVGAGTGELGLALARRGLAVDGLDLWPRPARWPSGRVWHQVDLRRFSGWSDYAAIIGNLVFHQFARDELRAVGSRLRARVVLACEPARRRGSQVAFARIAPLFRANYVTLHDARVSIAAGFCGLELANELGLAGETWDVSFRTTRLGAYRMVAVRREHSCVGAAL